MTKNEILVQGININYKKINEEDYISLTDIAKTKNPIAPADVVKNWFRTKSAIEYMELWESFHNPNFNMVEIDQFKNNTGDNTFTLSPQQWINSTNAIGVISKSGRYGGGTFAHRDIAFKFASWVNYKFEFYLIAEFQRLKEKEQAQLQWDAKRELAKLNYHIHTDAIQRNIIPTLNDKQIKFAYASEADLLNMALFGKTASDWRKENPQVKGNIRDYASIEQLLIFANMESYNAILLDNNETQSERLVKLNQMARVQMQSIINLNNPLLLDNK